MIDTSVLESVGSGLIDGAFLDRRPSWIGGQISHIDCAFLSGLVQHVRPQNIVEIGVASGWSSAVLLHSLKATGAAEFRLSGIDLFPEFYLDKSIPTGRAVSEVTPELQTHFNLLTGRVAFEAMGDVGKVDFAFIDAHHMHPWATIDMISVLPFIEKGRWVAMHDLNLCGIERHKHTNRGPFYLFYLWPDQKIYSTQKRTMIGAVLLEREPQHYLPGLLEILYTPWEIRLDDPVVDSFVAFVRSHYGDEWAQKFAGACAKANVKAS